MSEENTQSTYIGGEGKRSIDRRHPRACTIPHWSGGSRQTTDMARKITPIPVAVKKQGKDQRRWKLSHNHRWGSRGRDAAENKKKMECNHQHSRKQQEKRKKERKINMPKSMVGRRLTTHPTHRCTHNGWRNKHTKTKILDHRNSATRRGKMLTRFLVEGTQYPVRGTFFS